MQRASVVLPKLSLAPMVDVSFPAYRYLNRLVSRNTTLYTPMIIDSQLLRSNPQVRAGLLSRHPIELSDPPSKYRISSLPSAPGAAAASSSSSSTSLYPTGGLIAQLGGSDPDLMVRSARALESLGYDGININMGCPADSAQAGCHGAVLMTVPNYVHTVRAVRDAVSIPVSVKCRVGVDAPANYESFRDFIFRYIEHAHINHFIVHSRIALLMKSTLHNLKAPPLHPSFIHQLRHDIAASGIERHLPPLPDGSPRRVTLEYNGGLRSPPEAILRAVGVNTEDGLPIYAPSEYVHQPQQPQHSESDGKSAAYTSLPVSPVAGVMVGRSSMYSILYPAHHDAVLNAVATSIANTHSFASSLVGLPSPPLLLSRDNLPLTIHPDEVTPSPSYPLLPTFSRKDLLTVYVDYLRKLYLGDEQTLQAEFPGLPTHVSTDLPPGIVLPRDCTLDLDSSQGLAVDAAAHASSSPSSSASSKSTDGGEVMRETAGKIPFVCPPLLETTMSTSHLFIPWATTIKPLSSLFAFTPGARAWRAAIMHILLRSSSIASNSGSERPDEVAVCAKSPRKLKRLTRNTSVEERIARQRSEMKVVIGKLEEILDRPELFLKKHVDLNTASPLSSSSSSSSSPHMQHLQEDASEALHESPYSSPEQAMVRVLDEPVFSPSTRIRLASQYEMTMKVLERHRR